MIVQEDVPYTKEEVKAMVKTIHDLRNHLNQLRKANNRLGWHSAVELPKKPTSKLGRIIVLTLDGKLGFNYYVDGWDMSNVKQWCYPPKEE